MKAVQLVIYPTLDFLYDFTVLIPSDRNRAFYFDVFETTTYTRKHGLQYYDSLILDHFDLVSQLLCSIAAIRFALIITTVTSITLIISLRHFGPSIQCTIQYIEISLSLCI